MNLGCLLGGGNIGISAENSGVFRPAGIPLLPPRASPWMVITLLPGWKGILKGSGLRAAGLAVLGLTYFGLGHCAVSSLSQPARRVLPRQALTEATVRQRNVRKRVHPKSSFSTVRCMHGPSSLSSAHHFLLSQRFVTRACVSCTAPAGTGAGTPLAHVSYLPLRASLGSHLR